MNIAAIRDASGDAKCPSGTTPCTAAQITECISPDKHDTECPITDIKLVEASSYVASEHPGYTAVTSSDFPQLSWRLLTSRKANFLPLARFELTEEEPCVLSGAFKTKTNPLLENIQGRTRDNYVSTCPIIPLETTLEDTFRLASSTVTVNEATWLQETGIIRKLFETPQTVYDDWEKRKAENELKLWQRSLNPWDS